MLPRSEFGQSQRISSSHVVWLRGTNCFGKYCYEFPCEPFFRGGVQAGNDVSRAFTIGQLGERHDTKVIGTFECLDFVVSLIPVDTGLEASLRNAVHNLCEDEFPWFVDLFGLQIVRKPGCQIEIDAGQNFT